jgi:pilus assembly protein CpaB
MNWKTWFPLILAIVLGVVAAKAAHDWVLKNKSAGVPAGKFIKIVVAKADTQPGHELTGDDLTLTQMEATAAPTNSIKTPEEVIGRVTEAFMVKGQPLVESALAPKGAGSGLQALVPQGMRAVTMEVNEFSGVAGLLTPGCKVDIVSTMAGADGGQVARTVVQNVKITAVGQRTTIAGGDAPPPPNEMFRSVTLLVKLEDAESIDLACSTGRPRLVLRGGRDNEIVATAGVSIGELRGAAKKDPDAVFTSTTQPAVSVAPATQPVAVAVAERPHRTVKVIRGGQESTVTLDVLEGNPDGAIGDTNDPFDSK